MGLFLCLGMPKKPACLEGSLVLSPTHFLGFDRKGMARHLHALHLLELFFPLRLKGIHHYWKKSYSSWGLNQKEDGEDQPSKPPFSHPSKNMARPLVARPQGVRPSSRQRWSMRRPSAATWRCWPWPPAAPRRRRRSGRWPTRTRASE